MQFDDDRVFCSDCANSQAKAQKKSMPIADFEKIRKVNSKPLRWMFEEAVLRNGWATVTWLEWQCKPTGFAVFPDDIKHRCHLFKEKQ